MYNRAPEFTIGREREKLKYMYCSRAVLVGIDGVMCRVRVLYSIARYSTVVYPRTISQYMYSVYAYLHTRDEQAG